MIRKFLDWQEKYFTWVVVAAALIFFAIGLTIGVHQSVWFDEAYSIMLAKMPTSKLLELTSIDTHPPFYYLLLKLWANLFGWSELALRSLSVSAASLAIIFAGLSVRRMFGSRIAIMAMPFVMFAPFLLRFAFEIRMYALASLIGIVATYVLIRARQTETTRNQYWLYFLYGVLVALGIYTLYYMFVLWVAHIAWLFWQAIKAKQFTLKNLIKLPWVWSYFVSLVLFLPWLPAFFRQLSNGALAPVAQQLTVENIIGIISFEFLYRPSWQLDGVLSLVIIGVIAFLVYLTIRAFSLATAKQKDYLTLLAWYFVIPALIVALVSLARPMYIERYLAHVAIGGMLFVGVISALVYGKANRMIKLAIAGLVVVLLAGVWHLKDVGNYNFQRQQTPSVKEAAATITDCKDSTVLADSPFVAIELDYYLSDCQIYFYSPHQTLIGGYAPLSESPLQIKKASQLDKDKKIFYIYYNEPTLQLTDNFMQVNISEFDALRVGEFEGR